MVKVLNAGFYTTIQDFGRFGYQHYGVPYSGVMDRHAAGLANCILGNPENAAVLEMTMTGVALLFESETIICIAGADMLPTQNDVPISLYKCYKMQVGDVLSFGKLKTGFRCYLAVLGGFESENIMGSQSMCEGITHVFKISKHDSLKINKTSLFSEDKNASIKINNDYQFTNNLDVFKGPEFDLLSEKQQNFLLKTAFTISKNNNSMAYQLEETLKNTLKPIITSAVLPGTVQLTPSGNLIVLMRNCQTTGGYPRVLQLKETAINTVAQKFTGNVINFNLSEF